MAFPNPLQTYSSTEIKAKDDLTVETKRWGESIVVSCGNFSEWIPMRDSILMRVLGKTWEEKVRIAQTKVYEKAYNELRDNQNKDYSVSRFI